MVAQTFGQDHGAIDVRGWQQGHEFFAAVSAEGVGGAHPGADGLRRAAQHLVAGEVAVCVVDRFEVVEIEQDDRKCPTVALYAAELLGDRLFDVATVMKPRETVAMAGLGQRAHGLSHHFLINRRISDVDEGFAELLYLSVLVLLWNEGAVLVHEVDPACDRAVVAKFEKIWPLFPSGEGEVLQNEYAVDLVLKDAVGQFVEALEQILAHDLRRAFAAVGFHEAVPQGDLHIAIDAVDADVDAIDEDVEYRRARREGIHGVLNRLDEGVERVSERGNGVFRHHDDEMAFEFVPLQAEIDLHMQGIGPGQRVDGEEFVGGDVGRHHRGGREPQVRTQLVGDAVEAGPHQYIANIEQDLFFGLFIEALIVAHERGEVAATLRRK